MSIKGFGFTLAVALQAVVLQASDSLEILDVSPARLVGYEGGRFTLENPLRENWRPMPAPSNIVTRWQAQVGAGSWLELTDGTVSASHLSGTTAGSASPTIFALATDAAGLVASNQPIAPTEGVTFTNLDTGRIYQRKAILLVNPPEPTEAFGPGAPIDLNLSCVTFLDAHFPVPLLHLF